MTRKDYVALAAALKGARETLTIAHTSLNNREVAVAAVDSVAMSIAHTLSLDNPRFDYSRFIAASKPFDPNYHTDVAAYGDETIRHCNAKNHPGSSRRATGICKLEQGHVGAHVFNPIQPTLTRTLQSDVAEDR